MSKVVVEKPKKKCFVHITFAADAIRENSFLKQKIKFRSD